LESIKPEDKPKVIGLIVGLVAVLGFVIFRLVSVLGSPAAPTPVVVNPAPTTGAIVAMNTPQESVIDVPKLTVSASFDPFKTVLVDPNRPAPVPMSGIKNPFQNKDSRTFEPPMPHRLPGTMDTGNVGSGTPVTIVPEKGVPILKGIVSYKNNPSVVLSVDNKDVMAGLGQTLPGGFVVVRIREKAVDLRRGTEKLTLSLVSEAPKTL